MYAPTNDYYFSGHTSTMTLLFLGFWFYIGVKIKTPKIIEFDTDDPQTFFVRMQEEHYEGSLPSKKVYEENEVLLKENKMYLALNDSFEEAPTREPTQMVRTYSETKVVKCYAWVLRIVFFLGLLQTIMLLIVTSFHYTNDVLIGFVVGLSCFFYCHQYRFNISFFILKLYCFFFSY
jgi:uncharacterized membrane protein